MEFTTLRLEIRQVALSDLNDIHALHSLPATDEFNTLGIPETIQVTEELLKNWITQQNARPRLSYTFSINLIDTKEFIGLIALNIGKPKYKIAEVWYKTHTAYWKKGYTTESLKKILEFGFLTLGLHRIEAGCAVENIASKRVLEKAGMLQEGRKRKILPIRGDWVDNYIFGILETDFMAE